MKTAKERYEDFFKNHLAPFLKNKGFRRRGNKFISYGQELAYVFFVQRGKHTTVDDINFRVDLDFYVKNFEDKEDAYAYIIPLLFIDICNFVKGLAEPDFVFKTEDAHPDETDRKIRAYIFKTIDEKALPFIKTIHSIQDITRLLEMTPEKERVWNSPTTNLVPNKLAELYWILGQKQKAIEILDHKIATARTDLIREGGERLRERILKGGPFYTRPE